MCRQVRLLLKPETGPATPCQRVFAASDALEVRDLTTRLSVRIVAKDISCYLHTVFLDGRAYQILNVKKTT